MNDFKHNQKKLKYEILGKYWMRIRVWAKSNKERLKYLQIDKDQALFEIWSTPILYLMLAMY